MRLRLWANHRLTVTLYVILKTVHHLWNLVQFELHLSSSNSKTLRIGADRAPLSSKRVRKTLGPRGRDIYACGAQLNCHPYFLFCRRKNTDCVPETLCFYFVFKAPRWTQSKQRVTPDRVIEIEVLQSTAGCTRNRKQIPNLQTNKSGILLQPLDKHTGNTNKNARTIYCYNQLTESRSVFFYKCHCCYLHLCLYSLLFLLCRVYIYSYWLRDNFCNWSVNLLFILSLQ